MNSFKLILTTILSGFIIVLSTNAQETSEDLDGSAFIDILIEQIIADMPKDQSYEEPSLNTLFIEGLETLINPDIVYDPTYRRLDNMCDDIPADVGVCSDVVIRAFHNVGVCLAEYVCAYRLTEGLPVDTNIDHRRVRNLGALFNDQGWEIPVKQSRYAADYYQPGDIIWWKLGGKTDHIGIVTKNGKVLHNIGNGQVANVTPFAYRIHKVYRMPVIE